MTLYLGYEGEYENIYGKKGPISSVQMKIVYDEIKSTLIS